MTRLLCRIGWHDWIVPENLKLGDRRYCAHCARVEQLEPDYGGWTSGIWVPVDRDQ